MQIEFEYAKEHEQAAIDSSLFGGWLDYFNSKSSDRFVR